MARSGRIFRNSKKPARQKFCKKKPPNRSVLRLTDRSEPRASASGVCGTGFWPMAPANSGYIAGTMIRMISRRRKFTRAAFVFSVFLSAHAGLASAQPCQPEPEQVLRDAMGDVTDWTDGNIGF